MALGKYQIIDNKIDAFHFTNPYSDIDGLAEFGIDNFVITIKVNGDNRVCTMDVFVKSKCTLSVRLGDYIIKDDGAAVNPYKVIPQQIFEEKFEPVNKVK